MAKAKNRMTNVHSSTLMKFTTGTLAVLLTGSVAYGVHQTDASQQAEKQTTNWRTEAAGWQTVAQQSAAHDNLVSAQNTQLVHKYNQLVVSTKTHERVLLQAVAQAKAASGARAAAQAAAQASAAAQSSSVQAAAPSQVAAVAAQPAPVAAQPAPTQVPQSSAS